MNTRDQFDKESFLQYCVQWSSSIIYKVGMTILKTILYSSYAACDPVS